MAEIFGVVSGAVCILDATISLTGTFLKYVSDFRDEQKERIRKNRRTGASPFLDTASKNGMV
jgi:hypothetical protein